MNKFQKLISFSILASSLLVACGRPTPTSMYAPNLAPPTSTINQTILPPVVIQGASQPTLPDGKKATDIRFDMKCESNKSTSTTPKTAASAF